MEILLGLSALLLLVIPLWVICSKVGISPILSLAVFVPLIGFLIVLGVPAHAPWPNDNDSRLRR
jgi:hypothetical protein